MRVLVVEPEHKPQVRELPNTLETIQKIVGGAIEVIYPYDVIAHGVLSVPTLRS